MMQGRRSIPCPGIRIPGRARAPTRSSRTATKTRTAGPSSNTSHDWGAVPDLDQAAPVRRRDLRPIRAKGHAPDGADVAAESQQFLAGVGIPELDCLVYARGRDAAAIGTDGYAASKQLVSLEILDHAPG